MIEHQHLFSFSYDPNRAKKDFQELALILANNKKLRPHMQVNLLLKNNHFIPLITDPKQAILLELVEDSQIEKKSDKLDNQIRFSKNNHLYVYQLEKSQFPNISRLAIVWKAQADIFGQRQSSWKILNNRQIIQDQQIQ